VAAAQPVTAEAGNQGPARVAPAPAAAQAGNHDGAVAAPAEAEGGNEEGEHESSISPNASSSLDYIMTTISESTGTAPGIQEPTGSASATALDGVDVLDDNNVESGGATMDHPTGSGM
jgi:hypothetical protein